MTTTEERLVRLADEQLDLGRSPDLDTSFADSGVSSIDVVSFIKLVTQELGVAIKAGECEGVTTLRELASFIDSRVG